MKKSASGLADFAEKIYAEKWPYRFGSYGNIIAGKRRSDCYGIRKAYSWDRGPYSVYIAAEDQNAATAYAKATVKGNISTLPDRRGIVVCKRNALGRIYHAGIYVGNGMVIDIYLEGLPARKDPVTMHGWTLWFEDIFIDYTQPVVLPTPSAPKNAIVSYQSHIESIGWQGFVSGGEVSGTTGKSLRLEALKIVADNIKYRSHVQDYGWQMWHGSDQVTGTVGQSKRLEAIEIMLSGDKALTHDVVYQVHVQDIGWQDWKKNGETAGTTGQSKRVEAIRIKIVEKA